MENCNLLLLSNTSDAESKALIAQEQQNETDTSHVKIKVEVDDSNTNTAPVESQALAEKPEPASIVTDKWVMSQMKSDEDNRNNNRLSLEDNSTTGTVNDLNSAVIHCSKFPSEGVEVDITCLSKKETLTSADKQDDHNNLTVNTQPSDLSSDPSSSSLEVCVSQSEGSNLSCLDSSKESSMHTSNSSNDASDELTSAQEVEQIVESISDDQNTAPGSCRESNLLNSGGAQENGIGTTNVSGRPQMFDHDNSASLHGSNSQGLNVEEPDRFASIGNQVHVGVPQQMLDIGPQQQSMYAPIDGNYAYNPVPGMETLAATAVSQQMSMMLQQRSLEQSLHLASMTKSVDAGWNHSGPDASFGCPLASSTPDADGRRFAFLPQDGQVHNSASFIQAYQSLSAGPQPWQLQGKQGYPDTEQEQWMTNSLPAGTLSQHGVIAYDQTSATSGKNWDATQEAVHGVQNDAQAYIYPQQTVPLDMSPAAEVASPGCQANVIQPRRLVQTAREPVKRSHSASSLDSSNDSFQPVPKVAKAASENASTTGENYQISTNVHTLKPRHMISWYIDHLIQENENVTQISKSYTIPVNIFNSKDMYFMESVLKRMDFPTPRFLSWMQNNFPNINIQAVDFSEGRRPYFCVSYDDQLRGKLNQRTEIIKDTFFYFQQRKMN